MKDLCNMKMTVMQVVTGALGTVFKNLKRTGCIEHQGIMEIIQTAALLKLTECSKFSRKSTTGDSVWGS